MQLEVAVGAQWVAGRVAGASPLEEAWDVDKLAEAPPPEEVWDEPPVVDKLVAVSPAVGDAPAEAFPVEEDRRAKSRVMEECRWEMAGAERCSSMDGHRWRQTMLLPRGP
eukprot:TRINITY_DN65_c0_g1_i3.p3 TRINITY_DN65_c0_g1~~TRINITY_DN65_c0_g1_i3.p3  ORF type:complete len:110 (-),score=21.59 TRINITY_DN65_c0_g1_i3:62-391(-)